MWVGIVENRIISPSFFECNLKWERYLDFFQFELIPAFAVLFPNPQEQGIPHNDIWF